MALYPVKFVEWHEVVQWTAELSERVVGNGFKPDAVVAVGRGGFVVARLLCDFLDVSNLLCVPVKWVEQSPRPGEKYVADLVRGWIEASKRGSSHEEAVARVVSRLKCVLSFEYTVDLKGKRSLLVEEIVVTGYHMELAKRVVQESWGSPELRTATLVWKSTACRVRPDYFVREEKSFVWYQFPWSRLDDYKQFVRVALESSARDGKSSLTLSEVEELFEAWYGSRPDPLYLKRALDLLAKEGFLEKREGRVVLTLRP
jgi:hypoxanthine phosphoribosyltransferase